MFAPLFPTRWSCFAAALVLVGLSSAQPALARVEAEALIGNPFGVCRLTISGPEAPADAASVLLEEKNGRALYPAVTQGVIGRLLGKLLGDAGDRPVGGGVTIHFLFRGAEPLQLTVYAPQAMQFSVQPRSDNSRTFDRNMAQWWREYNAMWRQTRAGDDHPPLVPTYLTAMLSSRLGLESPLLERLTTGQSSSTATKRSLELLLGLEQLRMDTLKNTMLGRGDFAQRADLPLPAEPDWTPLSLPSLASPPEVEEIAQHVPLNWFYVRFGSFANYLWMDDLLQEFGGDIGSMVTLRSYLPPLSERTQDQLGLKKNVLGRLLGDTVIADVAIVGRDTFTKEGGAIGILFHARSTGLLKNDLSQQRRRALADAQAQGASEQSFQVAGQDISFFSTPDNRLRSFYAVSGDFHLVTTSRAMAEQFVSLTKESSLGQSGEFQNARQLLPVSRKDAIFAYFSTAFFQGLLSPQYQVELERRMKSVTDMELLLLARLAARAEGLRGETIEEMSAGGFLPADFGRRPDGSGPVLTDKQVIDSRRGARGTFLPIPDVKISGITREESTRLTTLSSLLTQEWRRMDPLLVGIQRFDLDKQGRERVVIDANMLPIDEGKYGRYLSMLGPPSKQIITTAEGDVAAVQALVRGGLISSAIPPHHLFLGLQDITPLTQGMPTGILQTLQFLRATPGYLGSWPAAGFLDLLPFNLGGAAPDANGFSQLPLGLWRRQAEGFSVLSFDPTLLARVTPQLRVTEAETEAQLRMHLDDLSQAKIRPWLNSMYYERGLAASAGNSRFLGQLAQQLHVPIENAVTVSEELLDGKLICPLGGKYELVEDIQGGARYWRSTARSAMTGSQPPEGFEAPLLKWFRGLDAQLTRDGDQVMAHAELDMQRKPGLPKLDLPFFGGLFGGGQKALQPIPAANQVEPKANQPNSKAKANELPPPLPTLLQPPLPKSPKVEAPVPKLPPQPRNR